MKEIVLVAHEPMFCDWMRGLAPELENHGVKVTTYLTDGDWIINSQQLAKLCRQITRNEELAVLSGMSLDSNEISRHPSPYESDAIVTADYYGRRYGFYTNYWPRDWHRRDYWFFNFFGSRACRFILTPSWEQDMIKVAKERCPDVPFSEDIYFELTAIRIYHSFFHKSKS